MKKNKFKFLIAVLSLSTVATSCSDDLNRFPHDSIEESQSFETVQDAKNWNNGMYANLRGRVSGIFQYSTDVQADQLNATKDFGNRNGFPHRWEGFLSSDYTIEDVWAGYYNGIANINLALKGFDNIQTESAAEVNELNLYKGDAHLARAFYYHQLVLRFAKAYSPQSAGSDLGVPVLLDYDISLMPSRSTVQEVYEQILADITVAKSLLSGVDGEAGAVKFNEDIALALEARVKLHMNDWAGAKTAADLVIGSGSYPLINTEESLRDMWVNDMSQEVVFQVFVSAPNELARANGIYLGYNGGTNRFTPDFVPSQWVVDMYDDTDFRKAVYFESKDTVLVQGVDYTDVYLVNKYSGNPELFTGANTNYQQAPKVFRVAEMYLISAEAGANMGTGGLAELNALREARGLSSLNVSGAQLLEEIKNERFRELAFEGYRLDDLKRWNEGFERRDPQNTDFLNIGSNYTTLSKDAGDDKFVWGIPTNDDIINPNIEQNPGW